MTSNLILNKAVVFEDLRGLVLFGTIITGVSHGLKLLDMHCAFSINEL